jgi:hypothetical protein
MTTTPQPEQEPLAPCPFCNHQAAVGSRKVSTNGGPTTEYWFINCMRCGSSNVGIFNGFSDADLAAEHWNRRDAQAEEIARLRKTLQRIERVSHKNAPVVTQNIENCTGCMARAALEEK